MHPAPISGTVVALATPFAADGAVDVRALRAHVEWLVEAGVDGLMPCGTTGEGALLADDEVVTVVGAVAQAAANRATVIAHVGRPSTAVTRRLGERALEAGADALSAVVPYYYPLSREQIRAHFSALLDGLPGVPLLAYTIPSHAHNDLEPEDLGTLMQAGLAGLKDSSKSVERHRAYAEAAAGEGAVLIGSDALLAEGRAAGGTGSVTLMANLRPELVAAVHHAFEDGGDARAAQEELEAARQALGPKPGPRTVKQALSRELADYPDRVRSPL